MNEERLSSMLKDFAQPLTARGVREMRVLPRRIARLGAVVLGGGSMIAAAAVILPARAKAETLGRIETAISNAKSMTLSISDMNTKGHRQVYSRVWFQEGKWRSDTFEGEPIAKSYFFADGKQFIYSPNHKTLTEEPSGSWDGGLGRTSALSFTKMQTRLEVDNQPRSISIRAHAPLDGREVYQLDVSGGSEEYRTEILVDKKTDLPVQCRPIATPGSIGGGSDEIDEFHFNEPIPAEKFDRSTVGLPVTNLTAKQEALLRDWAKPVADILECGIRNVWQNPAGEVFVVYTRPKESSAKVSGLTDSLGTTYLAAEDVEPGQIRGDTAVRDHFKFEKQDVRIAVFVPLVKPASLPDKVRPKVTGSYYSVDRPASPDVPVTREPGETPSLPPYTTTLVLRDYADQMAIHLATLRAEWYKDHKDRRMELTWRRNAYERAKEWLPGIANREYKPAVDRLEKEMAGP